MTAVMFFEQSQILSQRPIKIDVIKRLR